MTQREAKRLACWIAADVLRRAVNGWDEPLPDGNGGTLSKADEERAYRALDEILEELDRRGQES